jgi:hypothetical protein
LNEISKSFLSRNLFPCLTNKGSSRSKGENQYIGTSSPYNQWLYLKVSCPHQELLQLNDKALNVIYEGLDPKVFESSKDLEMAHHVWKRLEDS